MNTNDDQHLQTVGLFGDYGWNDADDADDGHLRGIELALLIAASGALFAFQWLLGGCAPLPFLLSRGHWLSNGKADLEAGSAAGPSRHCRRTTRT